MRGSTALRAHNRVRNSSTFTGTRRIPALPPRLLRREAINGLVVKLQPFGLPFSSYFQCLGAVAPHDGKALWLLRRNQKACPCTTGPIGRGTAISLC